MAGIIINRSEAVRVCEQPVTALYLITQGSVRTQGQGCSYQIGTGDVIGICELSSEVHFLSYVALEDTTVMPYPLKGMEALEDLLQKRPNIAKLFILSLFRQFNAMMEQSSVSEVASGELYRRMREDCELYTGLCGRHNVQSRIPAEIEEIQERPEDSPDEWLDNYYSALMRIYMGEDCDVLLQESGVSLGILRKGSLDFRKTYTVLEAQYQYRLQIVNCYFNASGNDMFDALTKLYYRLCQIGEDAGGLYASIRRAKRLPEEYELPQETQAKSRVETFQRKEEEMIRPVAARGAGDGSDEEILQSLKGSLETILDFAGLSQEQETAFRQHVAQYKAIGDKNSSNDDCARLRRTLTDEFYTLYSEAFERSLSAIQLPVPVRMFFYFGYVDEGLAGDDNSIALYRLSRYMNAPGQAGVYTFYDWLMAIYNGEKNPSRSELDSDYDDFVQQQKRKNNLPPFEVAALANNVMEKVRFELQNLFPSANKVTFGRITTYCPIFIAENVLKDLKNSFVSPDRISAALAMLKKIDFSAFYRETTDYPEAQALGRESINVEYLPDVILMPNAGIKGSLWQEIEGKKRNSRSRMVLPAFYMEDLDTAMVRMTGEFRWELCKRVQGGRWNDVTEPSLTSEYFDYMQFYKKNSELSKDAKEKLQNSLTRAKNSFREMFVRDYVTWVFFEGTGSARLNKVARKILFTYCPFPASLDSSLEQNPMYSELMSRQKILSGQRVHKLNLLKQKVGGSGQPVPDCLEREIKFASRAL